MISLDSYLPFESSWYTNCYIYSTAQDTLSHHKSNWHKQHKLPKKEHLGKSKQMSVNIIRPSARCFLGFLIILSTHKLQYFYNII